MAAKRTKQDSISDAIECWFENDNRVPATETWDIAEAVIEALREDGFVIVKEAE